MKHILVLDIETTGLDPNTAELIELSAIRLSPNLKENKEVFDSLVFPQKEVPPFVEYLTGISQEMVQEAPGTEEVREQFAKFVRKDDVICGHNIAFDTGFLRHNNFELPEGTLDTLPLARLLLPEEKSHALEVLARRFGVEHTDAHRALADVEANIDLLKILFERARELPEEAMKLLQKNSSEESLFLQKALQKGAPKRKASPATKKEEKKESQYSLFDFSPEQEEAVASQQEEEKILSFLKTEQSGIILLPKTKEEQYELAVSALKHAAQSSGTSCALVVPRIPKGNLPEGFSVYSPQCFSYEKWKSWEKEQESIEDDFLFLGIRLLREGKDLPATSGREEKTFSHFLSDNKSANSNPLLCRLKHVESCPAEKMLVISGENLEKDLDEAFENKLSLRPIWKWLEQKEAENANLTEGLRFGLLLLQQFFQKKTQESKYKIDLLLSPSMMQEEELRHLREGFEEVLRRIQQSFPQEIVMIKQFRSFLRFLEEDAENKNIRSVSIYPDDNMIFREKRRDMNELFTHLFGKKHTILLGSVLAKRKGQYYLGKTLKALEILHQEDTGFDFARRASLSIPSFGGNTKQDDQRTTLALLEKLCAKESGNILALFPSQGLAQSCLFGNFGDYEVVLANNSREKLMQKVKGEKTLILSSARNLEKSLDFSTANIRHCVQHRLLFDMPPDPAEEIRNQIWERNSFLDLVLPSLVQNTLLLLLQLTASGKSFDWYLLDAHFQNTKNFTDELLSQLPPSLPIERKSVEEMGE